MADTLGDGPPGDKEGELGTLFDQQRAMELLLEQCSLGVRAPGTPGHEKVIELFVERLRPHVKELVLQSFPITFRGRPVKLTNVVGLLPGRKEGPSHLVGSHYDTRWIADREPEEALRYKPILGANDGGSGTAIMLELARVLSTAPPRGDVILVFFDGEDLGGLDSLPYAVGSRYFSRNQGNMRPDRAIALDMVGGRGMQLNFELNSLLTPVSRTMMKRIWSLGTEMMLEPFMEPQVSTVISDHWPFIEIGIPAVLLIDINYPQWHTQQDTPESCSAGSMGAVGMVLERYLTE